MKKKTNAIDYKDLAYKYGLLSYFMDHIPDVIYFKDKKGKLILVNQAHAKGVGLKPEQVAGKTDFDFFPKERAKKMQQDDAYVMRTKKAIIDKIERATRPDKVDNYVSTTKIPILNKKRKSIGLIGITRDITRRMQFERLRGRKTQIAKKLEMLEEVDRLRSDFISTVSHELRTPLAIIKQLVTLVANEIAGPINDKQREIFKKVNNNIEALTKLIEELLDASSIEKDKLKLHYSLVNFNDLLRNPADFFTKLAQEKNINLDYSLPKESINLFIDADRINQVIANLITNAIKFTEQGGKVTVEVKIMENKIRVGVIDTGIGISKLELPHIFSKFIQISQVASSEKKGVGLGLSIVKELVEKHGGEIWVESKPGVGSKFYFTLLRFYTPKALNKRIKNKIDALLAQGLPVHFINLLMVNYKEFRQIIKITPQKLFADLKIIIDASFKKVYRSTKGKSPMILMDRYYGNCSIIFTGVDEPKAQEIADLLKDKIKSYFIKNKLENVFIALGFLSYIAKVRDDSAKFMPSNLHIKEIYIGSEMRRFRRVPYKTKVKLLLSKNKAKISQSVDISEGGLCIITDLALVTDSQINIILELPKSKVSISVRVRIAWMKKMERRPEDKGFKYKVGLEFMNLKSTYNKILLRELKI